MSTSHFFGGKVIKLPGAYAETKAKVAPQATVSSYSKIAIIDTGSNAGWGGGSGVKGELYQDKDSLYRFRSPSEFKAFVKGGPWYKLADLLFTPSRVTNTQGVSEVIWVSAKTTTAATITLPFTAGNIVVKCKDEGTFSNGVLYTKKDTTQILSKGYGAKITKGVKDNTKFIVTFYVGTFTGNYSDSLPYNEVLAENALPEKVIQSKEVSTLTELLDWMKSDYDFNLGFTTSSTGTGAIVVGDATGTLILATGGTETYGLTDGGAIDSALEALKTKDMSFILSDRFGSNAIDVVNTKLQVFCQSQARFKTYLVVGGGSARGELQTISIPAAKYFNSDFVWVVNGGIKNISALSATKTRTFDSLYHSAIILGRIAGTPPQVPPTFKEIDISGLQYQLSTTELEDCLDYGVLTSYYDEDLERFVILKGVNTLQNNTALVNTDGTSPSIQVRRIAEQINKEIVLDSKKELFTQREGVTILTLSPETVLDWAKIKLQQKIDRGLIEAFQNVSISRQEDAYFLSYEMRPAYEVNFLFSTGFIIE